MSAIEFHRAMLADRVRNTALHEALRRTIRPGVTRVADVGAGTGFLGLLARRLGAREVHCYEYAGIASLGEQIARANRIDAVWFYREHSTAIIDPPPVDLVISETLGNLAYEENIIETLIDARRFLAPGGVILPRRIEQFCAPLTGTRLYEELCAWDGVGYGLDFSLAKTVTLNNLYVRRITEADLLGGIGGARRWDAVDLGRRTRSLRRGSGSWRISRAQRVHGFALWWRCELVPGVELSTAPDAPETHWEQIFAPVLEPIDVRRGETLELAIVSDTRNPGALVRWEARVRDGNTLRLRQSLDLRKGDPEDG